ncbi:hypothetical protein JYT50_00825, partial [bacterium AH-315-A23]|nr:hypothetical protein [bacterium AH-315-A23]
MKQNFINTDKINNSKTLKQITSRILKIVDVERIYLNKGAREHAFEYRLNIITSQLSKDIASQIYPVIEMIFEEYPNYAYRFFSLQFVNQELYNGNLFFLNNCSDEELVYENLHSNSHWAYPLLNYHKVYEKAKSDFKKDICKIKSLKEGIKFYLSRNDFSQTAFMIH